MNSMLVGTHELSYERLIASHGRNFLEQRLKCGACTLTRLFPLLFFFLILSSPFKSRPHLLASFKSEAGTIVTPEIISAMPPIAKKDKQLQFVGNEVRDVDDLTMDHIRAIYGLGPFREPGENGSSTTTKPTGKKTESIYPYCGNRYKDIPTGSPLLAKGMTGNNCTAARCRDGNPHCLNYMGQEQWEKEGRHTHQRQPCCLPLHSVNVPMDENLYLRSQMLSCLHRCIRRVPCSFQ